MTGFFLALLGFVIVAFVTWILAKMYWQLIKDPDNAMARNSGVSRDGRWRPSSMRKEDVLRDGSAFWTLMFYANRWTQLGCLSLMVFVGMVVTAALSILALALGLSEAFS